MLQTVPLFGLGTGTKSVNVSAQSRTNLYAETSQEPDKTPIAYYPRPGLIPSVRLFWHPLATLSNGATVRGAKQIYIFSGGVALGSDPENVLVVVGNLIYWNLVSVLSRNGLRDTAVTKLVTSSGPVSIDSSGADAVIVDGAAGYCVGPAIGGLSTVISSANFPNGANTVAFLASRYFLPDPTVPGRFRWSALLDGTTYNALDFATAEFDADPLTATFTARGELMLFGTRTIEFWSPTGDITIVARINGTTQQWGTQAPWTIKQVLGSVVFMGRAQSGDRQVLMLKGYTPTPISTPDVDYDIAQDANPDAATADVYTLGGHTFYVLRLTSKSWVYDFTTGSWAIWRGADGGPFNGVFPVMYRTQLHVFDANGIGIYDFSPTTYTDNSNAITREVTSRHVFQSGDLMTCNEVVIDMETGVGANSGQGSDPQAMLQVSKDGGHTWSNELWRSIGPQGAYTSRVRWTRLGRSRDFMFRLRITDPIKSVLIGAYARFQ